jgi:predicted nucleic acid-binding protein
MAGNATVHTIGNVLADTGALLAVLDRKDRWHRACVAALAQFRLPLLTSEAVLTEFFHLVGHDLHQQRIAWRFVHSGTLTLCAITDRDLPEIVSLMERYADRPMDFADATLVHLAQRERISTVFTIDFADFQSYRIAGRQRFRIVPAVGLRS